MYYHHLNCAIYVFNWTLCGYANNIDGIPHCTVLSDYFNDCFKFAAYGKRMHRLQICTFCLQCISYCCVIVMCDISQFVFSLHSMPVWRRMESATCPQRTLSSNSSMRKQTYGFPRRPPFYWQVFWTKPKMG